MTEELPPVDGAEVERALRAAARERILVLDGAWGVMIQNYHLSEADFRRSRFRDHARDLKGNNDLLVLTQPDIIREIGRAYLHAGADIIESNSFNSTSISQADYGLESLVVELNETAARLASTYSILRWPSLNLAPLV